MDQFSFLGAAHIAFVDDMYAQYTRNPDALEPSWRAFFQGYDFGRTEYNGHEKVAAAIHEGVVPEKVMKEFKVLNLIQGYRQRGHLFTKTNPVRARRKYLPTLALENFGLAESDLHTTFDAGSEVGLGPATLQKIVEHLEMVFCHSIGVEYKFVRRPEVIEWIQNRLSKNHNQPQLTTEDKLHVLEKLTRAVGFEGFLHKKFVGQKRFSLEGGESLIPALDTLIDLGAELGVKEFVVGMAHRGRLNVLANIFGKTYDQILSEFEGKDFEDSYFDGDVKYHMGFTATHATRTGLQVDLNIAPNPSHLEAVDPVVEGIARAKINNRFDGNLKAVCPILIHGDAAIAGQGIVYEVVQMSQLDGYKTGGTIHLVVNNQVGFTTNYLDARTSTYCTDIAKVTLSPVLHVNADDVEAVVHCMRFAMEYRQHFNRDIFIDLLGYRKYGHNEGDEPRFTQPMLYKIIARHPNPRDIYSRKLLAEGIISEAYLDEKDKEFNDILEGKFEKAKMIEKNVITPFMYNEWKKIEFAKAQDFEKSIETGFPKKRFLELAQKMTTVSPEVHLYKKILRLLEDRNRMIFETDKLDWGMAELMAYATLLDEGFNVRISGQDVERGTFSHRHAIMKVEESEEEVCLLDSLSEKQGRFSIYNSHLSEFGVLGFDYGYSIASPESLVIWEAQFGDFSNGAQIIIDQFISSGEDKWKVKSGLVMFLPHGYEGQGAEHSSARLERYLQLCAELNMMVVNPTTPANHFHLIRRQMKNKWRKPLVVMTPKSLLRHPRVTATVAELTSGHFMEVLDDPTADPKKVTRLVFCSGKLYYELLEEVETSGKQDTAIVRIEQLYPLPEKQIGALLKKYKNAKEHIWAQEEPANMGAWSYMFMNFPEEVRLKRISMEASAAPATGSSKRAAKLQRELVKKVIHS
jgi:2-oxoglutarate dehydrogenase E1 component